MAAFYVLMGSCLISALVSTIYIYTVYMYHVTEYEFLAVSLTAFVQRYQEHLPAMRKQISKVKPCTV